MSLQVDNLTVYYQTLRGDVKALDGATFSLEDGEIITVLQDHYDTFDMSDKLVNKHVELIEWDLEEIEKGGFTHFMEKEIHEQPESISRARNSSSTHKYPLMSGRNSEMLDSRSPRRG